MEGVVVWYNRKYNLGCIDVEECSKSSYNIFDSYYFNLNSFTKESILKEKYITSGSLIKFKLEYNKVIILDVL